MILFWLDMLLIWEATGEATDPLMGIVLSNELSECFNIFGFLACWANIPNNRSTASTQTIYFPYNTR